MGKMGGSQCVCVRGKRDGREMCTRGREGGRWGIKDVL